MNANPNWALALPWMQKLSPAARNRIPSAFVDTLNGMKEAILSQLTDFADDVRVEWNEDDRAGGRLIIRTPSATHVLPFTLPPLESH